MMKISSDKTIQLHDGRALGYAEYGNSTGKILFYFHGHPGSRFEARFLADAALKAGNRLIGVDRPGMGLSTYKAGRSLLDFSDDVVELANNLKIDRFSVVGFSGGGPYVLACAYKIPNRLISCGIVSGVGHTSLFLSFLSSWLPWLILPMTKRFFRDEEHAKQLLTKASQRWVEPDKKALSAPGVAEIMAASLVEAVKQGTKGAAYDGTLIGSRNWGFKLQDITLPNLYLWHGEHDTQIPVTAVRTLAKRLTTCKTTYYPNEGHISLIVNRGKEISDTLTTPA
jgi:pimeloyl-ACP methyl ester carboxylesterase